jgi:hypothetical protein
MQNRASHGASRISSRFLRKNRKRIGNHRIRVTFGALPSVRRRSAPGRPRCRVSRICAVRRRKRTAMGPLDLFQTWNPAGVRLGRPKPAYASNFWFVEMPVRCRANREPVRFCAWAVSAASSMMFNVHGMSVTMLIVGSLAGPGFLSGAD